MSVKRIIPCLDVKAGRVVKGKKFVGLIDVGDPISFAKYYQQQGADEIVFLDIAATQENRATMIELVEATVKEISIPLTVGGGVRNINDFEKLLAAGANKLSINSAAVENPTLIKQAQEKFGSQAVVVAIDAKRSTLGFEVVIAGGQKETGLNVVEWAKKVENLGAGEILLTSMDADGMKAGFDLELLKAVTNEINIPVIASGGCGKLEDFLTVFRQTDVSAALAASLFHFKELTIPEVKTYLEKNDISVRR